MAQYITMSKFFQEPYNHNNEIGIGKCCVLRSKSDIRLELNCSQDIFQVQFDEQKDRTIPVVLISEAGENEDIDELLMNLGLEVRIIVKVLLQQPNPYFLLHFLGIDRDQSYMNINSKTKIQNIQPNNNPINPKIVHPPSIQLSTPVHSQQIRKDPSSPIITTIKQFPDFPRHSQSPPYTPQQRQKLPSLPPSPPSPSFNTIGIQVQNQQLHSPVQIQDLQNNNNTSSFNNSQNILNLIYTSQSPSNSSSIQSQRSISTPFNVVEQFGSIQIQQQIQRQTSPSLYANAQQQQQRPIIQYEQDQSEAFVFEDPINTSNNNNDQQQLFNPQYANTQQQVFPILQQITAIIHGQFQHNSTSPVHNIQLEQQIYSGNFKDQQMYHSLSPPFQYQQQQMNQNAMTQSQNQYHSLHITTNPLSIQNSIFQPLTNQQSQSYNTLPHHQAHTQQFPDPYLQNAFNPLNDTNSTSPHNNIQSQQQQNPGSIIKHSSQGSSPVLSPVLHQSTPNKQKRQYKQPRVISPSTDRENSSSQITPYFNNPPAVISEEELP